MLILIVLLIIDAFVMSFREGRGIMSLLPLVFAAAIAGGSWFLVIAITQTAGNMMLAGTSALIGGIMIYLSVLFLSYLLYLCVYSRTTVRTDPDYIIIHGCGLLGGDKVTPLLASRADKAAEAYEKSGRRAMIIASGGRGADEKISEAEAIKNYLIEQGLPESAILLEKNSGTTAENMAESKKIIDSLQQGSPCYCLFATSSFHVLRTAFLAKAAGLSGDAIGAKTKWYYWIPAFLREYAAIVVHYIGWLAAVIAVLFAFIFYAAFA